MKDIGRSGELWAHLVELESSNTGRATERSTPLLQQHQIGPCRCNRTTSLGSTAGTMTEGQVITLRTET